MAILREREVWRRSKPTPQGRHPSARIDRLSPEQEANVRSALRVLRARLDTWERVAAELGIHIKSVERVLSGARRPTVGWALRVAQASGVTVDAVLQGRWEPQAACPMCGHNS